MVTFLFQWIGKASLMRAFIMQKYMQTSKVKKINQPGTARVGGKVHVTVPSQTLAKKKQMPWAVANKKCGALTNTLWLPSAIWGVTGAVTSTYH